MRSLQQLCQRCWCAGPECSCGQGEQGAQGEHGQAGDRHWGCRPAGVHSISAHCRVPLPEPQIICSNSCTMSGCDRGEPLPVPGSRAQLQPPHAQAVQAAAERVLRSSAAQACLEVAFDFAELAASLRQGLEPVLDDVADSLQARARAAAVGGLGGFFTMRVETCLTQPWAPRSWECPRAAGCKCLAV